MSTFIGSSKANTINGSGGDDFILALGGADTIKANGGNDLIVAGSGGNDRISGGADIDTLVLNGAFSDYAITYTTVSGSDATALGVASGTAAIQLVGPGGVVELVTGVETIAFDDKVIQVVGAGSEHTVQSAVDAASNVGDNPDGGQAVYIGNGTFNENVTINGSQIDIIGQGAGTVINGALTLASGGNGDAPLFIQSLAVTGGVTIGDQSDIVLDGLTLSNSSGGQVVNFNGLESASAIAIQNSTINETSGQIGVKVADGTTVTGLSISDTTFNGGQYGIYFANDATSGDTVSGTFTSLTFNGQSSPDGSATAFSSRAIYVEKLTESTITDIVVNAPVSPANDNLRGIELNLKSGEFSNISISGVDFNGFDSAAATGSLFDPLLNVHTKATATLDGISIDDVSVSRLGGDANSSNLKVVTIFDESAPGTPHITGLTVTNLNVGGTVEISTSAYDQIANNTITGGDLILNVVDQPVGAAASLASNTVSGSIFVTDFRSVTLPEGADNLTLLDSPLPNIDGAGNSGDNIIIGNVGSNVLTGGGGDDTFIGGAGIDTVVYGAGATISRDGSGHWQVTEGGNVETLTGIEKVQIDGTTYLLVDKAGVNVGGFQTVQSAIDAAAGGETILVAPGAYTETAHYDPSNNTNNPLFANPVGLLVNHAVTIQGVDADGVYVSDANSTAATITSGIQSNWGTNFFVTAADVTINGLKFVATDNGGGEVNKAFEVVEDNFTMTNSFVTGPAGVPLGATMYINDDTVPVDFDGWVSDIASFHISGNVFEGDFVLANGAGYGIAEPAFVLSDNHFQLGTNPYTDWNWGIIITGQMAGVPWRVAPVALPEVTGNTFDADYTADRILFVRDDNPANMPDAQFVGDFIANNNIGNFAYATADGTAPSLYDIAAVNPYGAGDVASHGFVVALSAGNASQYARSGDTLRVQSGADDTVQTIVVDGLTVDALAGSTDLNLELDGGVITLSLAGAQNVDVTGNSDGNGIYGNDGINIIDGGAGDDEINGGGGSDTAVFSGDRADYTVSRLGPDSYQLVGPDGTDQVSGVENFQFADGTLSAEAVYNDTPVVTSPISDASTDEDAAFTLATASHFADQDSVVGDVLTYSVTGPSWLSINAATGELYGTPTNGDVGTPSVTVTATDAGGEEVSTTFTLTVVNTNDGPVVTSDIDATSTNEGAAFSMATASHFADADTIHGDNLTYSFSGPSWLSINPATGELYGTPTNDDVGTPSVTVTATDLDGEEIATTFILTVANTNDGPAVTSAIDAASTDEDAAFTMATASHFADADTIHGDVLTYSVTGPSWLSINATTGELYGTPTNGDVGSPSVTVTATDLDGEAISTTFTLTVANTNDGPVVTSDIDATSTDEGAAFSMATASHFADADTIHGDTLTYSFSGPSWLSINPATGELYGTPTNDDVGTPSVTVTATDLDGEEISTTFTLTVANTNDGPVAVADELGALVENVAASFDVLANDTDVDVDDTKTLQSLDSVDATGLGTLSGIENIALQGYFSIVDNKISFDPGAGSGLPGANIPSIFDRLDPGQTATISINYTMHDAAGAPSSATATFTVNGNSEIFIGTAAVDNISGTQYVDIIDGGEGADAMAGGQGNDTYHVDSSNDVVTENVNEGTDTIFASDDFVLSANVEKLTLVGTAVTGIGNSGANTLTGNAEGNVLDGAGGIDTYVGGLGDDTYFIDNAAELALVTEGADEGVDTVISRVNVTSLGVNLENVVLEGTASNANGNAHDNYINGNTLGNILDGGAGNDTLAGGLGNDTYIVDSSLDVVIEISGQGIDLVKSTAANYALAAEVENLTLLGTGNIDGTGNSGANVLTGNAGANTLDGGAGADTLIGGGGDDTYIVSEAGDVVIETDANSASGGIDRVFSSLNNYTLTANVESLILSAGGVNGTGNGLNNTLVGNDGDNILDGGAGADIMRGGLGNDTYIVDSASDTVVETDATNIGGGIDTILSSVGRSLASNVDVENLTLTGTAQINGTGNALDNILIGNSANNALNGGSGDDTIDGGAGNDTLIGGIGRDLMTGGAGNDAFYVDRSDDVVIETDANSATGGLDRVYSTATDYTLAANVEYLLLTTNMGAAINGTGNALNNTLVGNDAANVLDGGSGSDLIRGGLGEDTLTGGSGVDYFVFDSAFGSSNVDRITDFAVVDDTIRLENSIYTELGTATGTLSAAMFFSGSSAADASDRIIFDSATGNLYYDADGAGATAQVQIAHLDGMGLALTNLDFAII